MSTKHSRFLIQNARTADIVFSTHVPVYIYKGAIFFMPQEAVQFEGRQFMGKFKKPFNRLFLPYDDGLQEWLGHSKRCQSSQPRAAQRSVLGFISNVSFLKIMLIHSVLPRGVSIAMSSKMKHEEVTADTFRTVIIRTENEMAPSWDMTWHDPTLGQSNLIPSGKGVAPLPSQIL